MIVQLKFVVRVVMIVQSKFVVRVVMIALRQLTTIFDRVTQEAINAAMNVAINFTLAQATSKEGGKQGF